MRWSLLLPSNLSHRQLVGSKRRNGLAKLQNTCCHKLCAYLFSAFHKENLRGFCYFLKEPQTIFLFCCLKPNLNSTSDTFPENFPQTCLSVVYLIPFCQFIWSFVNVMDLNLHQKFHLGVQRLRSAISSLWLFHQTFSFSVIATWDNGTVGADFCRSIGIQHNGWMFAQVACLKCYQHHTSARTLAMS